MPVLGGACKKEDWTRSFVKEGTKCLRPRGSFFRAAVFND